MRVTATVIAMGMLVVVTAGPSGATDEPDVTFIFGKVAMVKTGQLAKCIMKPIGAPFDLPDVPGNDPTVEGGSIKFYERGFPSNHNTFQLVPSGWRKLRDPLSPAGFKYRGTGAPGDPCRVVLVKPNVAKAVCKGPDVTLMPPFDNVTLGVTLTIGTNSKRYCPVYFGNAKNEAGFFKSTSGTTNDGGACSPSGAFLEGEAAF